MYTSAFVIMIVCGALIVLGLLWYIRFQWIFWVYSSDSEGWIGPVLAVAFFLLLYGQFVWCFGPESGATFFSNGLKWVTFCVLQIIFFPNRWSNFSAGYRVWEKYGLLVLPLFVIGIVFVRLVFILCDEYRSRYQWENGELHQVVEVGSIDYTKNKPERLIRLDNGFETSVTDIRISVDQVVRLYDGVLLTEEPQSGLKKGLGEIKAAVDRKKARKAAKKQH